MTISQRDFTQDWFIKRPNQIFTSRQLRELLTAEYESLTGKVFGDPEKMVRDLYKINFLERPTEGNYVYRSFADEGVSKTGFSQAERIRILERDNFQCVICKRGAQDGIFLSVGFAKSLMRGGQPTVDNGRTFCPRHKFISEIGQSSNARTDHIRHLNAVLPSSDKANARSQEFWEEFIELLCKYGVDEALIYGAMPQDL
jgi:hypothetical protein